MLILNAQDILPLLSFSEIIDSVKEGFRKYTRGEYLVPIRMHLGDEQLTYLLMPAIGKEYYCTKLVSVVPSNAKRKIPIVSGTVTLNRVENGETIAMMDAGIITSLRTGAVGAIGFELLSQPSTESIGIIGCGVQGIWQTIFAASTRPIKRVYCYSRTKKRIAAYQSAVAQYYPELVVNVCDSADNVVEMSEVVYTCTTSNEPVFSNNEELISGKKFISVGSFRKDMQELPDRVYQNSDLLLIDANSAKEEVGDVINALQNGYFSSAQVIEIGKILTGDYNLNIDKVSVYKSVGMAAFDLALAESLYQKALELNIGNHVSL